MKNVYWYYLLPGAGIAYDVRFHEPKTEEEVRGYLAKHWKTSPDRIKEIWPGS